MSENKKQNKKINKREREQKVRVSQQARHGLWAALCVCLQVIALHTNRHHPAIQLHILAPTSLAKRQNNSHPVQALHSLALTALARIQARGIAPLPLLGLRCSIPIGTCWYTLRPQSWNTVPMNMIPRPMIYYKLLVRKIWPCCPPESAWSTCLPLLQPTSTWRNN